MTPAAVLVPVLLFLLLLAACWWGSNIVFHPPKMSPTSAWPDQFGLKYETVQFPTKDGLKLKGWLIPAARETDRTILLLHGWGDNKSDVIGRTHWLGKLFNLFYLDYRHHGESEGTRSTIGALESRDVAAALDFLAKERPAWRRRLGVYGMSMGGSVGIWTAAAYPDIRCAAIESPFPSFNLVVSRWSWNAFRLPYFPFTWLTLWVIRFRLGEDCEPYSPLFHVGKIAPRPLFLITGAKDTLMPLKDVKEIFEGAREPKELWVIDEATHGKCEETAGPEFHRRVSQFFERTL